MNTRTQVFWNDHHYQILAAAVRDLRKKADPVLTSKSKTLKVAQEYLEEKDRKNSMSGGDIRKCMEKVDEILKDSTPLILPFVGKVTAANGFVADAPKALFPRSAHEGHTQKLKELSAAINGSLRTLERENAELHLKIKELETQATAISLPAQMFKAFQAIEAQLRGLDAKFEAKLTRLSFQAKPVASVVQEGLFVTSPAQEVKSTNFAEIQVLQPPRRKIGIWGANLKTIRYLSNRLPGVDVVPNYKISAPLDTFEVCLLQSGHPLEQELRAKCPEKLLVTYGSPTKFQAKTLEQIKNKMLLA